MDAAELGQYDLKNLISHPKFGFQTLEVSKIVPLSYDCKHLYLVLKRFSSILISFLDSRRLVSVCLNINWCYG